MIFRNLDWNKNGLNINGENLNHLRFADDLILFSKCPIKLEQMLQQLSNQKWYPRDGKRNKGRPIKRWEDDIKGVAGPEWTRIARETDRWKSLEEAFVERQAVIKKTDRQPNIKCNESCIYDAETKRQCAEWVFPFQELSAKLKRGRSAEKKMMISFFGMTGHYTTTVLENSHCRLVH
ncbi:hypothetical protein EVAR_9854_1 [Eumeta japonica]|uniref:Reverse transcriptase domain-containing protein n=1 Tax=Eumeta variegata TaxID=151549 RepID=A0A4C1TQA3_EUMVA|nr:hypothetical protein EVAR_9854_1 [Eumeta japonica]